MKLLIDIGNSRTKYLFNKEGKLSELESINNEDANENWLTDVTKSVEKIVVASVSEEYLLTHIEEYAQQQKISFLKVESEHSRFGVTSSYQQPTTLGVDRWLTLLAADLYCKNKNVLIIDAGTATTADLLDHNGNHLGGWILPGIDILFNSLLVNTSQISATQKHLPNLSFGKNTSEGVNGACWAATLGFIEQAIVQSQMHVSLDKILITGGNAEKISSILTAEHQVVHQLVFIGLQRF